mmetsp:Transcript_10629/g.10471  ORF Transcript_10629/g.10471 Transcript_10629/m.10471 type:complete len:98 (-) Transcript_10629:46-339(-)|eukprot:CAMPEP_0197005680 /NCGR_PEP_ID=MMETSP1380-20130617/30719_1 /TAXON_ID=5936 /ORGANISM="Euplotes crassus, Strain CT5" /LENGTH=97 /DNA_ID=CAMNT_0042424903 /DNA_START=32 /DNA_END=325 /DNA_ORIENTATION=+
MSDEIDAILNDDAKLQEIVDYCFQEADANGDGTIDSQEFESHIKMVYEDINIPVPTKENMDVYMSSLDINSDGKLDKGEFKKYVIDMLTKDKESRAS